MISSLKRLYLEDICPIEMPIHIMITTFSLTETSSQKKNPFFPGPTGKKYPWHSLYVECRMHMIINSLEDQYLSSTNNANSSTNDWTEELN